MKVNITIPKARKGKFSEIKLGYKNEENEDLQVLLNVDFQNLYEFTRKKNGIGFDVFLIGCFVYGIDILLPRKNFSVDGWSRVIEVEFPVESPDIFNNGRSVLKQLLSFLTGDYWQISFIPRDTTTPLYISKSNGKVFRETYCKLHKNISVP